MPAVVEVDERGELLERGVRRRPRRAARRSIARAVRRAATRAADGHRLERPLGVRGGEREAAAPRPRAGAAALTRE